MGWWKIVSEKTDFIESVYFPFSEKRKKQWGILINRVEEFLNLKPGNSVIELCCGTAALAVGLAEKGYSVTGLDKSPTMLGYAGMRAAKAKVDISLIHREVQNVAELGRKYDAVTMLDITFGMIGESKYDDIRLLESIFSCLNNGGRFLLEIINPVYFEKHKRTTLNGGFFKSEFIYDNKTKSMRTSTIVDGVGEERKGTYRLYGFELLERILTEGIGFKTAILPDAADSDFMLSERQTLYILCEK